MIINRIRPAGLSTPVAASASSPYPSLSSSHRSTLRHSIRTFCTILRPAIKPSRPTPRSKIALPSHATGFRRMSAGLIPPNPADVMVIRNVTPRVVTFSVPFSRFGKIKIGGRGTLGRCSSPHVLFSDINSPFSQMVKLYHHAVHCRPVLTLMMMITSQAHLWQPSHIFPRRAHRGIQGQDRGARRPSSLHHRARL